MPKRLDLSAILLELDSREQTEIFEIVFPDKEFRLVSHRDLAGKKDSWHTLTEISAQPPLYRDFTDENGERWIDFVMHRVMKPADQEVVKVSGLLLCGLGIGFDGYYKPSQVKFMDKRPEIRLKIEVDTEIKGFAPIVTQEYDYFKGELYDVAIAPAIYINRVVSVPALKSVSAAMRLRLQHYHYEGAKLMARLLKEGAKNPAWAAAIAMPIDESSDFQKNLNIELGHHNQQVADECNLLFSDYNMAQTQTNSGLIDIALGCKDGTAYRRVSLMPNAPNFVARVHQMLVTEVFSQAPSETEEEPEEDDTFQPVRDGKAIETSGGELPIDAPPSPKRGRKTSKVATPAA
jgi:hypothetical protein